jgi:hypothetical protein
VCRLNPDIAEHKEATTMTHKNLKKNRNNPACQNYRIARTAAMSLISLFLFLAAAPFEGRPAGPTYPISAEVKTTRDRTVRPVSIPGAQEISMTEVSLYGALGYSSWEFGAPVDYGALLPDGSAVGAYNPVETLLTYFSISDTHITDEESPAQGLFFGVPGAFGTGNTPAYSPVMLYTTQVLDAVVQTINALNAGTPFDFGIGLGDPANSNLYNGLRWHIDVLDGKRIAPSSGAHKGADTIDYQKPFQAAGLDKSIPWYQVIGNHDQYWSGALYPDDYVRSALIGNTVINMGVVDEFPSFDARGIYMGVIDGSTPYGNVIDCGLASTMTPPVVAPDGRRHALTTATSSSLNWMKEFFNTTSKPKGHGFTKSNLDNDFVSYTFEPKASVPVKVIVLDDTCKENPYASAQSYSHGCLDQERYDWLTNELDKGQAEGKLMIVAAHVPVGPQTNVPDAPVPSGGVPNNTVIPMFFSTCHGSPTIGVPCAAPAPIENNDPVLPYTIVTDASLLATLHNYSNLILWMAGHRHMNVVTPQPAPSGKGPEFGFWEVETPSTRDFPQGFRTFEITRNDNNTVSIRITTVDPAVQGTNSPALTSRGYAIGAYRIATGAAGLTDTTSHVYNGELIKPLAAPYTVTVNVTGPGAVNMGPYQADTCTVSHSCQAAYLPGTQVTLTPTAGSGAVFAGWSACTGTSTCAIVMSGDVTVTATFTAAPTAAVSPAYKNFGNVKIGKKTTAVFTVKNAKTKGTADLTMGTIAPGQTDGGQFGLVAGKDKCSGKTLAPGKSCTFQASFLPSQTNTRAGTVIIPSDDPASPITVQLTGVGK